MKLSSITHELSARALSGEWSSALVDLTPTDDYKSTLESLPEPLAFSRCVRLIAEEAPVRVTPGELLIGSATLRAATLHVLPVLINGEAIFGSTSHVTFGFDRVLRLGYSGMRKQIMDRLTRGGLQQHGIDLLNAMLECLDAAGIWHSRYIKLLEQLVKTSTDNDHWQSVLDEARFVPENPPTNFREAVQALWSAFCFQHLCGNWPGIGRIDQMLGSFLKNDLKNGLITLDEARELLAHFWIKGAEWAAAPWAFGGSGDAQFYQNVILGGVDESGKEITNDVTYLILDVVEELRISDYPIAVRLNKNSPERLLRRIAEVESLGGGIVSVYSEDTVISALQTIGISLENARRYTNDGCWEPQVPGETCFIYDGIDVLQVLQNTLGVNEDSPIQDYPGFDSLYNTFVSNLHKRLEPFHQWADGYPMNSSPKGGSVLASLMTENCVELGLGYSEKGANYNITSAHAGGIPDTANSLIVIRELVYNRKELTLPELVQILRNNWEGHEDLRLRISSEFAFYGNDCEESDAIAKRVLDDFVDSVNAVPYRNGVYRTPGVSTFGREIGWRHNRGATAAGYKAGDILACNFSPTPGTDNAGPTAALKSFCSMGLNRLTGGAAMELKFHPSSVEGPAGIDALVSILKVFVEIGGFYMQVDSVSKDILLEAQKDPNHYSGLAVRVSGWSARFVTLNEEWQEMIINRTEHR